MRLFVNDIIGHAYTGCSVVSSDLRWLQPCAATVPCKEQYLHFIVIASWGQACTVGQSYTMLEGCNRNEVICKR